MLTHEQSGTERPNRHRSILVAFSMLPLRDVLSTRERRLTGGKKSRFPGQHFGFYLSRFKACGSHGTTSAVILFGETLFEPRVFLIANVSKACE